MRAGSVFFTILDSYWIITFAIFVPNLVVTLAQTVQEVMELENYGLNTISKTKIPEARIHATPEA